MLLLGTQMHIITFVFICIEIVIFLYLLIYRLARPDDKKTYLNILLVFLLIVYNMTGGLLPDPNLPGSYFTQMVLAYSTGFITPCYFPFYMYRAFELEKMKFHAYVGVFSCLIFPYLLFVAVFAFTNDLESAKNLLILPVVYGGWVLVSLWKALQYKYHNDFHTVESRIDVAVLFLSLSPWMALPVIDYFNLGQASEASITNIGFLLLLSHQLSQHIKQIRIEHVRLIKSEKTLLTWNIRLQHEVNKRTKELRITNEQRANALVSLAHEIKTPLTLINNYVEDIMSKSNSGSELAIIKGSLERLSTDIINLFDVERFSRGFGIYDHTLISDFSAILRDSITMFQQYATGRGIMIKVNIENNLLVRANPVAVTRIINNLLDNAIKFSPEGTVIFVELKSSQESVTLSVKDQGIGIPPKLQKHVFKPYYRIKNAKKNIQGMGLGLPIIKKIIGELMGSIAIISDPEIRTGTEILVSLKKHILSAQESVASPVGHNMLLDSIEKISHHESVSKNSKHTILIVEDNPTMLAYLFRKVSEYYNTYGAENGHEAMQKLKGMRKLPDLIISDIVMDNVDGFKFARIVAQDMALNHIPIIFISGKTEKETILQGLKLGAIDFIQKPFSVQHLLQKIEAILSLSFKQKEHTLASAIQLLTRPESQVIPVEVNVFDSNCKIYNLSIREIEIARWVNKGKTYSEIANLLFISPKTVEKHIQNIFTKVNVSNKLALVQTLQSGH